MNPLPLRSSLLALGLAAALAACHKQEAPQQPPPPEVGVITAQPQTVPLVQDQVGRLSAYRTADVRARVPGILLHRLYEEGTDVKAGQPLFKIDPQPLKAELDSQLALLASARASAVNSKAQADRARGLIGKNYVSRQDLDTAEANERTATASVKQAEANVQSARINLGYTDVVSPIDGRANQQQVTEGALVGQGDTTLLTTVDQIDKLYVNFTVSATDLDQMRRAAKEGGATLAEQNKTSVKLSLPDGTAYPGTGVLDFSSANVDPQTGTVNLRAVIDNPERALLPGQYVTVKATLGDRHNVFLVPQRAVQRDAHGAFVMVVGEGKAKDPQTGKETTVQNAAVRRPVDADNVMGANWLVTGGLKPGDRIIVDGLPKAKDNTPVKATPTQAAGGNAPAGAPAAPNGQPAAQPAQAGSAGQQ